MVHAKQRWRELAVSRWPRVEVDEAVFGAALDELTADGVSVTDDDAQTLWLALGCAAGSREAMAAFENAYFKGVASAVAGVLRTRDAVPDVEQALRTRLFIGHHGETPRVVSAAGRGDMAAFVRLSATRIALNLSRGDTRAQQRNETYAAALGDALDDPELNTIKATHRDAVKGAFEAAIEALSPKQRNLLRHHLVEHLNIDQIAALYGVHRATAARWLAAARDDVARGTRQQLRQRLGDEAQAPGLLDLVHSRLELSISRVLA